MAHKKSGGKTTQQTTRPGKRLGIKVFGGQEIKTGAIILHQRGTRFHPGEGVGIGRDHTLFALRDGKVLFKKRQGTKVVCVS
jgi:large subunit ribosomal protein L27